MGERIKAALTGKGATQTGTWDRRGGEPEREPGSCPRLSGSQDCPRGRADLTATLPGRCYELRHDEKPIGRSAGADGRPPCAWPASRGREDLRTPAHLSKRSCCPTEASGGLDLLVSEPVARG